MSILDSYSQETFVTTQVDKLSDTVKRVKEEKNKKQLVMYTKEQINRAKEVIKLHHSLLDHPSNKTYTYKCNK